MLSYKTCLVYFVRLLSLLIVLIPSTSVLRATTILGGDYYALVIGNNNYNDKRGVWKPLKNPINDALAVVDVLKQQYGFSDGNIRLLTDATRGEILSVFNEIYRRVKPKDSVLIYYAGHGYLNEDTREAYWIPVDAQGHDETNYLSNETIKRKLGVIADKASHVLLVSDSCFSGTLVRGAYVEPPKTTVDYYRKIAKRKSVQVVAAGGKEFVDDDYRSTGHSPFTYFFIKELQDNTDPYLALNEFAADIAKNVANNVRQTPVLGRPYGAGDENGEFIFSRTMLSPELIREEISSLLAAAEKDFKARRFIAPPRNNARYRWAEVLRLDTQNNAARHGLKRIAKRYVDLAEKDIEKRHFDEAAKNLKIAEDVKPDYKRVETVLRQLKRERESVWVPIPHW
jgi:hypothetical protein